MESLNLEGDQGSIEADETSASLLQLLEDITNDGDEIVQVLDTLMETRKLENDAKWKDSMIACTYSRVVELVLSKL